MADLDLFQARLDYQFHDLALLEHALTHPSWLQDHPEEAINNQRLEFLGDAVLQLALTEALFQLYPEDREGDLSKRRAALTKGPYLAQVANEINLADHLKVSRNEDQMGGRHREAALEDAFEAVIGAVFVDGDYRQAKQVVLQLYGDLAARLDRVIEAENPKGRLQERVQPTLGNDALRYEVTHVSGQDHAREFEARIYLQDDLIGTGRGSSKKTAEEQAARDALASSSLAAPEV